MLMAGPFFGSRLMPRRIRLIFSIILTLVIVPAIPLAPSVDMLSLQGIVITMQQIIIGVVMGFALQIALQPFLVGGQLVAMQTGLGFASLVDPSSGASVPLISQFFLLFTTLVMLALNVHLSLLKGLAQSFHQLPIGGGIFVKEHVWEVLHWAGVIFSSGLLIAMPAVFGLLTINFAFGLMTRAAPQLNIFAIGFPFTLTVGLFIIYVTLPTILPHIEQAMMGGLDMIQLLTG